MVCGLSSVVLLAVLPACDFTTPLEIEAPAHEPRLAIRATLSAGQPASVRLSLSRDPFAPTHDEREPGDLAQTPTETGAEVSLWREGELVEVLAVRERTCYRTQRTTCDEDTGINRTERADPFPCGHYRGSVPIEAGATYTIRAEGGETPTVEATATLPDLPTIWVSEEPGPDAETRRLRIRLRDRAGLGEAYGISLHREYDAFDTSFCAVGGRRDTTIELLTPSRYLTAFQAQDSLLRASTFGGLYRNHFVTVADDTFDGQDAEFVIETGVRGSSPVRATGRLTVQVASLSPLFYEAHRITTGSVEEGAAFAEPLSLPTNVEGGYGRVGAVAPSEASVE